MTDQKNNYRKIAAPKDFRGSYDPEAISKGAWFRRGDIDYRLRMSGTREWLGMQAYWLAQVVGEEVAAERTQKQLDLVDATILLAANYVMTDWRGMLDEETGEEIEFSPDYAEQLLAHWDMGDADADDPDLQKSLLNWVNDKSGEKGQYRRKMVKNSRIKSVNG